MSGKSAANGEANSSNCWVELYGAGGQLRLLRKDWAALILIAYDHLATDYTASRSFATKAAAHRDPLAAVPIDIQARFDMGDF